MSHATNTKSSLVTGLIFGLILAATIAVILASSGLINIGQPLTSTSQSSEAEPLYWVAPMDSNFRRDKPGKSPMGMDLVPVYEESEQNSIRGAVKINPQVVQNLGVRRGQVEKRVLEYQINTVGYVQYNEENLIHLHPRVSGWIEKLSVNAAGDPVTKGQAVYTLYSPEIVNAQEELLIALQRSNRALIKAAEARLKALQLSDEVITELKRSKQVTQTVTFYAPQSGVVDNLKVREGFFVQPGTTLMSVGNLDTVWVEAELFDRQAALVNENDPVTLTLDYIPGYQWQGKVDYIYPTIDSSTRTVRLRVELANNSGELKPNMFAQMQIKPKRPESVLTVPREAVIRTGSQNRVVVELNPGEFKSVAVTLGRSNRNYFEVLGGLNENDTVVTSAQFLIDSESSKTSDFLRMAPVEEHAGHSMDHEMDNESYPSATVSGVINTVNVEQGSINISRGPIEKWDRPATTMDFQLDAELKPSSLKVGSKIVFTFEIRDGDFVITDINADAETEFESESHQQHQHH